VAHFDDHFDEDAISAFVEGRLEEAESSSLVSHLVQCASCRYTTAQLVRLESQLDSESEATAEEGPGRLRSFIDRVAAHLTPSFEEDAVFAYQDPEPDQDVESANEEVPQNPKTTTE
jgi:anti-sigma factor RsiW